MTNPLAQEMVPVQVSPEVEIIELTPFQQAVRKAVISIANSASSSEEAMTVQNLLDAAANINLGNEAGLPGHIMAQLREGPVADMNKRIGPSSAQPASGNGQETT